MVQIGQVVYLPVIGPGIFCSHRYTERVLPIKLRVDIGTTACGLTAHT
jgi:hypothetical protein